MFKIIYAKSVFKDLKKMPKDVLINIKLSIGKLKDFPNITNLKSLKNHPLADYRLRAKDYRILFDVNWQLNEIQILKIGHRSKVY